MKKNDLKDDKWKDDFQRLMDEGKKRFRIWLKKNHMKRPKTEEEMYELINKLAGRMPYN